MPDQPAVTSPQSDPTNWDEIMAAVFGETDMDRARIVNPTWLSKVGESTRNWHDSPWNDDPSIGNPGQNQFTMYRKLKDEFYILTAKVDWFEAGEGGQSPRDRFRDFFLSKSESAMNNPNGPLSPRGFDDAAESFYNAWMWMDWAMGKLQAERNQINSDDSGFRGSAAQAFAEVIDTMHAELEHLRQDLNTDSPWWGLLHGNATAIRTFFTDIHTHWTTFTSDKAYDPSEMIRQIVKQLGEQCDQYNNTVMFDSDWVNTVFHRNGRTESTDFTDGQQWTFTLEFGGSSGTYDMRGDGLSRVNTDLHERFKTALTTLDTNMLAAYRTLATSLDATRTGMHNFSAFVPPPSEIDGGGGNNDTGGGNNDLFGGGGNNDTGSGINTNDLFGGGGDDSTGGSGIDTNDLFGGDGSGDSPTGGGSGLDTGSLFSDTGGSDLGGGSGIDTGSLFGGDGSGSSLGDLGGDTGSGSGSSLSGLAGLGGLGGLSGLGSSSGGKDGSSTSGSGFSSDGLDDFLDDDLSSGLSLGSGSAGLDPASFGSGLDSSSLGSGLDSSSLGSSGGLVAGDAGGGFSNVDTSGRSSAPDNGFSVGPLGTPLDSASAGTLLGAGLTGLDGSGSGVAGAGTAGATTSSGGYPPMMPPMGGMGGTGGGKDEKERERTTWLDEEEEVWGTDPDLGPAVIGRDDVDTATEDAPYRPAAPQQPNSPYQPARGNRRATGR